MLPIRFVAVQISKAGLGLLQFKSQLLMKRFIAVQISNAVVPIHSSNFAAYLKYWQNVPLSENALNTKFSVTVFLKISRKTCLLKTFPTLKDDICQFN